jgi:hypothetical protein
MRTRNHKLQVWLNDHETYQLKRKSESCKMTCSTFIRFIINGYEPREAPPVDYYKVMAELRVIGNNLNQIAHRANATDVIDAERYAENADALIKITDELMSVFLPKKKR